MAEINIQTSNWKLVEVGRVVLFVHGPYANNLGVIVEIIDHKRVLVDGPSIEKPAFPRHSAALSHLTLTPIIIPKLPRAAGKGAVARAWEKEKIDEKWAETTWAKRKEAQDKRRNLSDFERFKVMKLKKQARFEVRKSHAGVRAAAKA